MARIPAPDIRAVRRELLDPTQVLQDMKKLRGQGNVKALVSEASSRGYTPADSAKEVLGLRQTFESVIERKPSLSDLRVERDILREPVTKVEFEIGVQSFRKQRSNDQGAIVRAAISAGRNKEVYEMLLEARSGDFDDFTETTVDDNGKVVEAESWWTAFRGCLPPCGPVCLRALVTCKGTWAQYIGCVLWHCIGCGAKCAGCATCNCRWWCRWGVGCCRQ